MVDNRTQLNVQSYDGSAVYDSFAYFEWLKLLYLFNNIIDMCTDKCSLYQNKILDMYNIRFSFIINVAKICFVRF